MYLLRPALTEVLGALLLHAGDDVHRRPRGPRRERLGTRQDHGHYTLYLLINTIDNVKWRGGRTSGKSGMISGFIKHPSPSLGSDYSDVEEEHHHRCFDKNTISWNHAKREVFSYGNYR